MIIDLRGKVHPELISFVRGLHSFNASVFRTVDYHPGSLQALLEKKAYVSKIGGAGG